MAMWSVTHWPSYFVEGRATKELPGRVGPCVSLPVWFPAPHFYTALGDVSSAQLLANLRLWLSPSLVTIVISTDSKTVSIRQRK